MKNWLSTTEKELGIKCKTAGCLASIMSFDPSFKEIGFDLLSCDDESLIAPKISMAIPHFERFRGMQEQYLN